MKYHRPSTCITLLASAIALMLTASAHADAPYEFGKMPGKLPRNVIPLQYSANLVPDLASKTFSGTETVEIEVLQPTRNIMLNVANIEFDSATLTGKGIAPQKLVANIDTAQQTVRFALEQTLPAGHYQLTLAFRGAINHESRGLFAVPYKEGEQNRFMLTSTMEPSDARRMLPLWDEPSFRAKFKLSVEVPANFSAYSNTEVETDEKLANGKHRVSFAVTPKMASYLVMLTAGELERNTVIADGTEMGFITTRGKQASTSYASDSAKLVLHYYNDYFGMKYPLKKLDHIAVPGSFHGAMENWGGIVYNETTLLWDANINAGHDKRTVFSVTAHEMAHQWFGNLVTMGWWDNLWLNEAFASWMESKTTNSFHPEWRAALHDMLERNDTMALDSRISTHPVQTPIQTETEAASAFDGITYIKGQAVLAMLENWIGEDAFRRGIQAYMAKHQYGNTTSFDLWQALEKASGKPVGKVAANWITQAGLPLIKVTQACDNDERKITFSQQRFFSDSKAQDPSLWQIPLQFGILNGKTESLLLTGASTEIKLKGCAGTLVVDPQSRGYYRVQYDAASFKALAANVTQLPDNARLKLVNDTWALVGVEQLPLDSFIALIPQLKDEQRLAVWLALIKPLEMLDQLASDDAVRPQLRQYIRAVLGPKLQQLGWDEKPGDNEEQRGMRKIAIKTLAQIGDPGVIKEARERFAAFLKNPASLSPASRDVVMGIVGRYADEASYDQLLGLTIKAQGSRERQRYGMALMSALDPKLAARSLAISLRSDLPAEVTSMIVPTVAENEHIHQAWEFATAHRDTLIKLQDALMVTRFFPAILESSTNARDADLLESYVKQNFGPDVQVQARRSAESIRVRAKRKLQLLPQLSSALKANNG
jgi:aminopeptidase N